LQAANQLYDAGLRPLLVQNKAKLYSGHLWVFSDRDTDAYRAQAAIEALAPALKRCRERYPKPPENPTSGTNTGLRIRFPAGCYVTTEGERVPVLVGVHRGPADVVWAEGDTAAGWALLLGALSDAAILETTHIPVAERPKPAPPPERNIVPVRRAGPDAGIQQWCLANPIDAQVPIERGSKFRAPWRSTEHDPSVHYYASEGRFHDYGDPDYHGDAFDLYMILRGFWDPKRPQGPANPDYRAACADAGIARSGELSKGGPSLPLPAHSPHGGVELTSAPGPLAQEELTAAAPPPCRYREVRTGEAVRLGQMGCWEPAGEPGKRYLPESCAVCHQRLFRQIDAGWICDHCYPA
jgi:hypothetical protein